jgi:hypothetical protein
LVFLYSTYSGNPSTGPSVANMYSEINTVMSTLGGGSEYQLVHKSLAGYPSTF